MKEKNEQVEQTYIEGVGDPQSLREAQNAQERAAAEEEISSAIKQDTKAWYAVYAPMKRVISGNLYVPTYKSASAWVTVLATKIHRNESLLWRYYHVGQYYDAYVAEQERKGAAYTPPERCSISANMLRLIADVAGNNAKETCKLIKQAEKGKLSSRDLEIRKKDLGRKYPVNGYDARKARERAVPGIVPDKEPAGSGVTATAIKIALARKPVRIGGGRTGEYGSDHWIIQYRDRASNPELDMGQIEALYGSPKYAILTEFPVATGVTDKPRQIDALALESFTAGRGSVAIHGIEIKVSDYDLRRDQKMGDYAPYVDYMWVCVPESLLPTVEEVVAPSWGVLVVTPHDDADTDSVSVAVNRLPERTDGMDVEETLRTAIRKII